MARTPKKKRTFHQELVLNRWMLSHFHGDGLMTLKARLGARTTDAAVAAANRPAAN